MPDSPKTPFRVSIYHNFAIGLELLKDWEWAIRMCFEEAHEAGMLDRPVELIVDNVWGAPNGSAVEVGKIMREIVYDKKVHAMIGLAMTEDCIVMRDEINERMKIPVLTFSATLGFDGEYCFQAQCGTFYDEAVIIANFIKQQGHATFGLMHDTSFQGEEFADALRHAARDCGLVLAASQPINSFVVGDEVTRRMEAIRATGTDAFVYLGMGSMFPEMKRTLDELGWNPFRMTGLNFNGAIERMDGLEHYEGWHGLDQFHPGNPVLIEMNERFRARYGRDGMHMWAAHGFDEGRAMAIALANADPPTPEGIRDALEQVRMLPAAVGAPGNVLSFGRFDHRGYKGDNFVVRRVKDGVNDVVAVPSELLAAL